jgi:hypothetical protein
LIENEDNTNIEDLLHHFNNIAPSLNFSMERENKCSINFLDLTIHRKDNSLSIDIFRKPNYTDAIINTISTAVYNTVYQFAHSNSHTIPALPL